MYLQGPFNLGVGPLTLTPPGSQANWARVILTNASPYACQINTGSGPAPWLNPWTEAVYDLDPGDIPVVTPTYQILGASADANLTVCWLQPGEPLPGSYPVSLTAQALAAEVTNTPGTTLGTQAKPIAADIVKGTANVVVATNSAAPAVNVPLAVTGSQIGDFMIATLVLTAPPAQQTFTPTGRAQTFTVPTGVTSLTITCRGGQGGDGGSNPGTGTAGGQGGLGGLLTGTVAVTPGQQLVVYPGDQAYSAAADEAGGGGGGASIVLAGATALLVAGGGGGGGGAIGQQVGGNGGSAVGTNNGIAGGSSIDGAGGGGGTSTAGGSAGQYALPGTAWNGGTGAQTGTEAYPGGPGGTGYGYGGDGGYSAPSSGRSGGGGGGGGFFGGGGGSPGAGGGAGSGHADPSVTNITAGDSSGPGSIVITWQRPPSDQFPLTVTASTAGWNIDKPNPTLVGGQVTAVTAFKVLGGQDYAGVTFTLTGPATDTVQAIATALTIGQSATTPFSNQTLTGLSVDHNPSWGAYSATSAAASTNASFAFLWGAWTSASSTDPAPSQVSPGSIVLNKQATVNGVTTTILAWGAFSYTGPVNFQNGLMSVDGTNPLPAAAIGEALVVPQ